MTELRIDLMPLKFTHCLSKFMRNGSLAPCVRIVVASPEKNSNNCWGREKVST
jgi:hypothetical protein